jgi:gliding motility-associated lipoprotein GldH
MKRGIFAIATLFVLWMLTSCEAPPVFEENKPIVDAKWNEKQPVQFEFDIQDTVRLHNFYINVRNGENYAYSNLYLFVEMEFPNGKLAIDTLSCPLADATGKWYGSGLGDIYDNRIIYRERKQFPLAGHYRVSIYQAMRNENLEGIYDIGFRLSTAN